MSASALPPALPRAATQRASAPPPLHLRPRLWLCMALLLYAAFGAVQGWHEGMGREASKAWDFAFYLLGAALPWLWLRADAHQRRYSTSASLGGAVIGFALFALPWYLWRSRKAAQRPRALLAFAGFIVLLPCAYLLAGAPLAWWLGAW